jgi:putative membrane protein
MRRRKRQKILKGMAAGLVGGLVASFAMNQFQSLWSKLASSNGQHSTQRDQRAEQQSGVEIAPVQVEQIQAEESEPATIKFAEKVSEGVFHHPLSKKEKQIAEPVVHYSYGAVWGGIYGAVAQVAPETAKVLGLPFGVALWGVSDELAVPALGLSKWPTAYPLSSHAQALAAHAVYGITTDLVRRAMLKAIT